MKKEYNLRDADHGSVTGHFPVISPLVRSKSVAVQSKLSNQDRLMYEQLFEKMIGHSTCEFCCLARRVYLNREGRVT